MPIELAPEWQTAALYAVAAAIVLTMLFRIPHVGRVLRSLFSVALLALVLFTVFQQAPFQPGLAPITERLGLDRQEVRGEEVRIAMSPDGHFWARASINGVERRMLIDSGATVTAISQTTADLAQVKRGDNLLPVAVQTANGMVPARTGTIERLSLGSIEAERLKVVIAPALGKLDVLGMNFLSQLKSWRVEGRTLILVP